MQYRKVTLQDARQLVAYKKQVFDESEFLSRPGNEYEISAEYEKAGIEKMLCMENALIWLAIEQDEIIGCLNIRPGELERQKHTASIGVSVKKAYWSKGIGRTLMNKAIEFFNRSKLHRLELMVVKENVRAVSLYKNLGFQEEGVLSDFSLVNGKYQDVIMMAMLKNNELNKQDIDVKK